jgi:ParB-like chromosome segregation protein Spo0J
LPFNNGEQMNNMNEWPADKVERRAVSALIPYARNARTHSPEQVAQIAASIREWGWTVPVLIDDAGSIIAGHGRIMAASQLGLAEVPVMVAIGWTEAQKRAYVLADNKLAMNAGWDMDLLKIEVSDLSAEGFAIDLIGFSESELTGLLAEDPGPGLTDPDAAPEVQDISLSALGDIWLLGNHRLMCGDSTSIESVEALMAGQKADMVFTDPPYGMSYGGGRAQGNHSLNKRGG